MILFSLWHKRYLCWLFFLWWIWPDNSSHLPNKWWKHYTFPSKMLAIDCLTLGRAMGNLNLLLPSPCLSSYLSLLLLTSFLPLPPFSYLLLTPPSSFLPQTQSFLTKAGITMYTHVKCVPACYGLGWVLVYYDRAKRKKPELRNILPIRNYNCVSLIQLLIGSPDMWNSHLKYTCFTHRTKYFLRWLFWHLFQQRQFFVLSEIFWKVMCFKSSVETLIFKKK